MSEQIKLRECPFCSAIPVYDTMYIAYVVRHYDGCALLNGYVSHPILINNAEQWNTRTEDKRIEKALEEIEVLENIINHRRYNFNGDIPVEVFDIYFPKIKSILKGEA